MNFNNNEGSEGLCTSLLEQEDKSRSSEGRCWKSQGARIVQAGACRCNPEATEICRLNATLVICHQDSTSVDLWNQHYGI